METSSIKDRLKILLKDDALVEDYIMQHGDVINLFSIKKIKESRENKEKDPIYKTNVSCPICEQTNIDFYKLLAKSQAIKKTIFLIPKYTGANKFFTVNFNLIQTIVCPQCFFASPDPKDFTQYNTIHKTFTKSQLLNNVELIQAIRNETSVRKELLPAAIDNHNYFLRPRGAQIAIESIRFSIMRAKCEQLFNRPSCLYKLGVYHLKIAHIAQSLGQDIDLDIEQAEKYFREAVINSNCPTSNTELESVYQVIALNIRQKKQDSAAAFINIFKQIETRLNNERERNPTSENLNNDFREFKRWEMQIKTLWDYRNEPDYWASI